MLKNKCSNYVQNTAQEHFYIFECPLCLHRAMGMRYSDNKRPYEYSKNFDPHKMEKEEKKNQNQTMEID